MATHPLPNISSTLGPISIPNEPVVESDNTAASAKNEFKVLAAVPLYPEPVPDKCKGLFYRGKNNEYINADGHIVCTKRLIPLNRKSCTGCETCGWMNEFLVEDISNGNHGYLEQIEHGELYELMVTDVSTDWETGYADDVELGFIKVKEK